jgi:pimeloyl-ACP methyl ester carboxylesterase
VGRLLRSLGAEEARAAFTRSETARALASKAPDNLASLLGFFERKPQEITAALLTAIAADGPGVKPDEVRAIAVPTLVIGHGRDLAHPFEHAEALAGLIPGARLVRIAPKADDRARYVREFRAALQNFLADLLDQGGLPGSGNALACAFPMCPPEPINAGAEKLRC